MANIGYKALVKSQSSATVFTDEATTTSDDTTYKITNTAKQIFDYDTEIVVEDSAVATTEDYIVNRLDGSVTFESVDAGRVITFTGKYVTLTTITEAKAFSFDGTVDMGDKTVFQNTAREYEPLLLSATATIGMFYDVDNYFINMLIDGEIKVVEFYYDNTEEPFRFYALVSGDSLSIAIESLIEESVSLQVTDKMIVEA